MTQDVEPLTWQKRTNIEEHQQFFSKINEIIANLAPTVDEAEAAIAQATQALADANAAIGTANAASAAADAAAQQTQTAAATVAGYDTRLSQVENKASVNQANIATLSGQVAQDGQDIAALQNVQADYVKKAGAAQTVTSQIMVPTTATGLRDTQIANGTRIQNDLDNYAGMIRTTGNQTKTGELTLKQVGKGTVQGFLSDSLGPDAAGKYKVVAKFPRAINYGARQHLLIATVTRQRERPMDLMNIYINGTNAVGLSMIIRANTYEAYTYVLSQDDTYIYLSIVTRGDVGDGLQVILLAATQSYTELPDLLSELEIYDSVPGTEIRRLAV